MNQRVLTLSGMDGAIALQGGYPLYKISQAHTRMELFLRIKPNAVVEVS